MWALRTVRLTGEHLGRPPVEVDATPTSTGKQKTGAEAIAKWD